MGTVDDLWQRYERSGLQRLSPYTRTGYRDVYHLRVEPVLGHVDVSSLSVGMVEDFLADIARAGLKWATVRNARTVLGAMLTFAARREEDGIVLPHVVRRAQLPTQEPVSRLRVPEASAVAGVLADIAATDPALWLFERISAVTGARRGEVCALKVDDLLDGGIMFDEAVRTEHLNGRRTHEIGPTKTRGTRYVAVDEATLSAVRAWNADHGRAGEDLIFADARGNPVNPDIWSRRWQRACAARGLATSQHGLRHLAATITAEQFGISAAQARLGHSRVTTTERYVHQRPMFGAQAADALAKALEPADPEWIITWPGSEPLPDVG